MGDSFIFSALCVHSSSAFPIVMVSVMMRRKFHLGDSDALVDEFL